jgi:hypothetical protein
LWLHGHLFHHREVRLLRVCEVISAAEYVFVDVFGSDHQVDTGNKKNKKNCETFYATV